MNSERCFYAEAVAILGGTSIMPPEKAHLEAMQEHYECQQITIMNDLEQLKRKIVNHS